MIAYRLLHARVVDPRDIDPWSPEPIQVTARVRVSGADYEITGTVSQQAARQGPVVFADIERQLAYECARQVARVG